MEQLPRVAEDAENYCFKELNPVFHPSENGNPPKGKGLLTMIIFSFYLYFAPFAPLR
jgi:hypothetical protein